MFNLTQREIESIQCAANGHSAKCCADQMGISIKTYYAHILNARIKTKASNVSHLVSIAHRGGIITMILVSVISSIYSPITIARPARPAGRIVRVCRTRLKRRDKGCINDD